MRNQRFASLAAVVVLAVAGLVGMVACESLDDVEAVAGVREVAVEDNSFTPRVIEVPQGTEVTWRWDASRDHNVVGDGFQSPVQEDGVFTHTFEAPGTYDYQCTLHGPMTGRVIVTAN